MTRMVLKSNMGVLGTEFLMVQVVVNNLADEIPRFLGHGQVDVQLEGPLFYAFLTEIRGATTVQ